MNTQSSALRTRLYAAGLAVDAVIPSHRYLIAVADDSLPPDAAEMILLRSYSDFLARTRHGATPSDAPTEFPSADTIVFRREPAGWRYSRSRDGSLTPELGEPAAFRLESLIDRIEKTESETTWGSWKQEHLRPALAR